MNQEKLEKKLTLRYIFMQSFFWMSGCCTLCYSTVFLLSRGFTNTEVGTTLALANVLAIVCQPMLASFADKTTKVSIRQITTMLLTLSAVFSLAQFFLPKVVIPTAILTLMITALTRMQQTFITSLAMEHIYGGVNMNFSLCRGIGSLSFALVSLSMGFAVERFGASIVMLANFVFIVATMLVTARFPRPSEEEKNEIKNEGESPKQASGLLTFAVKNKRFLLVIISLVLIYLSHVFINTFTIQIMNNVGGSSSDMGIAAAIGGFLELPAMALFPFLLKKIGSASAILKISGIFMVIKALVTLAAPNVAVIYVAQCLQFFSYAMIVPACIYYVNRIIASEDKVKGQSCMDLSLCISGVIGNILGGVLLDLSGVATMLVIGIISSTVGVILLFIFAEKDHSNDPNGN